jgi:hypothetical protein
MPLPVSAGAALGRGVARFFAGLTYTRSSQIDVVDRGDTLAQCRRKVEVGLKPLDKALAAKANQRGVPFEQDDRVVRIRDVDL